MIIGFGNSAIPFVLYAYAALYLPSSLSVILNSTSPMFAALFGFLLLGDRLTINKYIGVILGSLGVGIVSSVAFTDSSLELYLSIAACMGAALLYGLTGAYVKKRALHIEPKQLTIGSLSFAGLFLIVLYLFLSLINLTPEIVTDGIGRNILLVILFGIMCTGIPYIVYYRLLQEIGPVKALTVTYLMPVFGLIWSLMYGEKFVFISLVGLIVILIGIYVLSLHKENEKSA
jgi:drug/metabolite transporter (DMT)-like permease